MYKRMGVLLFVAVAASAEISPERYLGNVKALSSERFKGRGNDLPELHEAAKYMAEKFRGCGLEPVRGAWTQPFRATTGASAGPNNKLSASIKAQPKQAYRSGMDFVPVGDSGEVAAGVVFAGYGITANEYNYDDYAHLDVKGKIVLVLRHEPRENDETSVFMGKQMTRHAGIVEKAVNARLHGAAALLLVNDPLPHEGDPDSFVKVETLAGPEQMGLPAIQVSREVAEALLASTGKNLRELQAEIDRDMGGHSTPLAAQLEMNVDVTRHIRELQNVAGMLPGNDPAVRDEVIVIGAHYDHLGLGQRFSMAPSATGHIHHGADDNASGSAGLIELACDLAQRRKQLKRTVLFLAFAGEELGLLGSSFYTRSPLFELEKTVAMLNLDMIGRPKDRKIYIGGVGTANEFRSLVEEENRAVNLKIEFSNTGFDSSDHTSFAARQVPVLFFFSGLHSDYHRPSDTWEKINTADAVDVLRLAQRVALRLDAQPQKPLFVRVAEPSGPARAGGGGGGYGAWFGSVPDFGEVENGVRFADVREGSPAAQAGLRAGDVLVEFAGKAVKNLNDFTYLLRAHKPGDQIAVVVLRNKEKITARVTLGRRPG